jgi:hypothetical protein
LFFVASGVCRARFPHILPTQRSLKRKLRLVELVGKPQHRQGEVACFEVGCGLREEAGGVLDGPLDRRGEKLG